MRMLVHVHMVLLVIAALAPKLVVVVDAIGVGFGMAQKSDLPCHHPVAAAAVPLCAGAQSRGNCLRPSFFGVLT